MNSPGPAHVIGVDVGSASARAGVFSSSGRLLGQGDAPFTVHRPRTDHAEHSSDEIWSAVAASVKTAVAHAGIEAGSVRGIAFDATCSLAMFDSDGRPVSVSVDGDDRWNVVMWADHRARAEAEEISATGHKVLDYVGSVMSPEMEVPKLLWLRRHLPKMWARYGMALDLADFLAWRATGKAVVSVCTVTCKWTYLAHEKPGWQNDFFAAIGLEPPPDRLALPQSAAAIGSVAGTLSAQAARDLGLDSRCVVGVGLIDAHAGGIGVLGGFPADDLNSRLAMIAGTSTCHMAVSQSPRAIRGVWGPYHGAMLPGLWLNEAGQSATGSLLDHVLDWHAQGRALTGNRHDAVTRIVNDAVAEQGPGFVGELQVLPDFHGNRSPLADPHATGVIHGLTLESDIASLARLYYATCIGIAFGTRHIVDALNATGYAIDTAHLTGGHTANPLLVSLYADATGLEIVLPQESEGVLLGTACVAATAAGLYPTLTEAGAAMVRPGRVVKPDGATRSFFEARYRAFLAMHEHRKEVSALSRAAGEAGPGQACNSTADLVG